MSITNKKLSVRFLCTLLSLVLLMSTLILPVSAVKVCTNGHKDADANYLCDVCGAFTGKVTGLKAVSVKATSAKITWNAVPGADGYKVYSYSEFFDVEDDDFDDDSDDDFSSDLEIADVTTNSATLELISAMTEKVYVCAYKNAGRSQILGDKSEVLTITTPPTKVSGLKKKDVLATSVKLVWNSNSINDNVKYRVYQYNNKTKKWDKIKTTKYSSYTVKGLKKKTTYKFRVEAFYKEGGKTYTGNVSKTLTVKTGDTQLNLKSTVLAEGTKKTLYVDGVKKNAKITWSTSDKKVATVSSKGVVKAVKAGKATITAKVGKKSYTCNVQVKTPTKYLNWYFKKNESITTSLDSSDYALITFEDGEFEFAYTRAEYDLASCSMEVEPGKKNAEVEITYMNVDDNFNIVFLSAETDISISKYTGKNYQPKYKFEERSGIKKADAKTMSNEIMADAFAAWNKLLKKNTGLTMKAFGFTSYKAK